jgi:putative SOS response-associated peptidase YedK
MIKAEYDQYRRLTGAEMDLEQFMEICGWTPESDERRVVPRAVERWFDDATGGVAARIRESIRLRRAAQEAAWQQELFAQKKRLAEAERKLAAKPTKAAAESQRIATAKIDALLARLNRLNDTRRQPQDARIFPMHYAPIVVEQGGRRLVRLARYHCRLAGKPATVDGQFPGLYNARRDNLEKYWRGAFGTSHALLLVESFFENVQQGARNAVLHFQPRPATTMLVACLYSSWRDPASGRELLSFAAITDDPPPEVAATGHDRMIVSLKPANVAAWLDPRGQGDAGMQGVLSDRPELYYEHEVMAA